MTTDRIIRVAHVRAAFQDVRASASKALALLDAGDIDGAYAAAETAQLAAFDAKALIAEGGRYTRGQNDAAPVSA